MPRLSVPIKNFLVVSEDEDVEDPCTTCFKEAVKSLNDTRDREPDKAWTLIAEIEA